MRRLLSILILILLVSSCRTSKVVNTSDVERINTGTITKMDTTTTRYILNVIEKYHRDTIVERLITQEEVIKNAITERIDTLYIVKENKVQEQQNTQEIATQTTTMQQINKLMWSIAVVIALAIILLLVFRFTR